MRTVAILPVKRFNSAKQRLRGGLGPELRASLAEAMLEDVLDALARSEQVERIVVVSGGAEPRALAEQRGARALPDLELGHNQAALVGIREAVESRAERVLLVPGDCPALDPRELDALLARRVPSPSVLIVPDRHGTGTNALVLSPPDVLAPSFGPGSCARHGERARSAGIATEVVPVASLALDIDTPEDLDALSRLTDRAPRTLALLSRC